MQERLIVSDEVRHFHGVRFYNDSHRLGSIVADFLMEGFRQSQPGIVIATPAHRAIIYQRLADGGFDPTELETSGLLVSLDAHETLEALIVDGMPDAWRFRRTLFPVIERARGGRQRPGVIRAYGEMVDVLWKTGRMAAAAQLEVLWSLLAQTQPLSLICGYALDSSRRNADLDQICLLHSHLISEDGVATALR
jgi:hypothetical protein